MGQDGLVSVIIPTHYRNDRLESAIKSVFKQKYTPIEVIVVDDSGEKHALPVIEQYEDLIYLAHDSNQGVLKARQTGFEAASGEYIQFLDDDDRLLEGKIESQVNILEERDDIGVVYCGCEEGDGTVISPSEDGQGDVRRLALRFDLYPCQTSTMLIQRTDLEAVTPLPDYPAATDNVLKIKLAHQTNFEAIAEPLVYRHDSPSSIGDSVTAAQARLNIIRDFDYLYNKYPELKQSTLVDTYTLLGRRQVREGNNFGAVKTAFNGYFDTNETRFLKFAFVWFFGRSGMALGQRIAVERNRDDSMAFYIARYIRPPRVQIGSYQAEFNISNRTEFERVQTFKRERELIQLMLKDISPSDIIWDIGANIGTHSCFLGQTITSGELIAFEPEPTQVKRLRTNLSNNLHSNKWQIKDIALSDVDQTGTLTRVEDVAGEGQHHLNSTSPNQTQISIQEVRAESLLSDSMSIPDLIKVDVEGAELKVLKGFGEYINDVSTIYLEVHRNQTRQFGTNPGEVTEFLTNNDFTVEQINDRDDAFHVRARQE